MPTIMKLTSILSIILTILFALLFNYYENETLYTLAITTGAIAYHFTMRLIVGYVFNFILKNKVNYSKKWFNVSKLEMKIYKLIITKNNIDKNCNAVPNKQNKCHIECIYFFFLPIP